VRGRVRRGRVRRGRVTKGDFQVKYTILLVDDETSVINALYRAFRKDGYNILKADNPVDALDILKREKAHLILSDYRMPEMDGITFLREAMNLQPDAIRMILSGYAESSIIISAINDGGIYKFITKPWEDDLLKIEVRHALERYELENTNKRLIEDIESKNEYLSHVNKILADKIDKIEEGVVNTIEMLSYLSKTKTLNLIGNVEEISRIGKEVGKRLGLGDKGIKDLYLAIKLHDTGNIGIDSCIFNKSGSLTSDERVEVKRHPVIGEEVLSFLNGFGEVAKIVRHHHEYYDGAGYPDGLKGDEIPLLSRIVHILDVYDSLTNNRSYRRALEIKEVEKILLEGRGKMFDPAVLDMFFSVLEGE